MQKPYSKFFAILEGTMPTSEGPVSAAPARPDPATALRSFLAFYVC